MRGVVCASICVALTLGGACGRVSEPQMPTLGSPGLEEVAPGAHSVTMPAPAAAAVDSTDCVIRLNYREALEWLALTREFLETRVYPTIYREGGE